MVKQKFPVYKQSYIFKISIPSPSFLTTEPLFLQRKSPTEMSSAENIPDPPLYLFAILKQDKLFYLNTNLLAFLATEFSA
jgi:hypothetical protein